MKRLYFGSDGIRGQTGTVPITKDFVRLIGLAIGTFFQQKKAAAKPARILVGQDTRASGATLVSALQEGLAATGSHVVLGSVLPSPAIAYLVIADGFDAGIAITASHNPHDHNGIKIFLANGCKSDDEAESAIEALLSKWQANPESASPTEIDAQIIPDASERYANFCRSALPDQVNLAGVRLVLDCAHGAAAHIAPKLFAALGAEVQAIGVAPNGHNINLNCGALHTEALAELVIDKRADLGVALDGDGDRVVLVDNKGEVMDGDDLLFIAARSLKQAGKLQGGVVGTVMTNTGLEQALAKMHIPFARAAVGDRQVVSLMKKKGWQLGGENSGHLLHLDVLPSGDGIISALKAIYDWQGSGKPLHIFRQGWKRLPQTLLNINCQSENSEHHQAKLQAVIEDVRQTLGKTGRLLIRPSGTEACIRVLVEAPAQDQADQLAGRLATAVKQFGFASEL